MKKVFTIAAALVLVIAAGSVLADEFPTMSMESRDIGTLLNTEAPEKGVIAAPAKDYGHPVVPELFVDVGTQIYLSAFETKGAESVTGAAAGGVAKEDENTRIWDHLMDAPGRVDF